MLNFIKNFRNDEDGAVTVDWVVLTAAIVALGLIVGSAVKTGAEAETTNMLAGMNSAVTSGLAGN